MYWLYVRTDKKMRRGPIFVFIEFLKRSRWSEMECHLSLLEQTTIIDRTNKLRVFVQIIYVLLFLFFGGEDVG